MSRSSTIQSTYSNGGAEGGSKMSYIHEGAEGLRNTKKEGEISNTAESTAACNTNPQKIRPVVPNIAHVVEQILEDSGIQRYDARIVQPIINAINNEARRLLSSSLELASLRTSNWKDVSSDKRADVTIDDARLAVEEYMQKFVVHPSYLLDEHRIGSSNISGTQEKIPLNRFPSSLPPYLSGDVSVHTMIPSWDLKLLQERQYDDMEDEDI